MKYTGYILLTLVLFIFLFQIYYFWSYTAADAFIIFRYASHFAAGYGMTWNPGQSPIEGYTTWLWTLLLTIPLIFHLDILWFAKITGILAMLATLTISFKFILRLLDEYEPERRSMFAAMGLVMLSCFSGTAVHSISGMETALATFLTISFLYYLTLFTIQPTKKIAGLIAIIGLLTGLTRPESNLLIITGLVLAYIFTPKKSRRVLVTLNLLLYLLPGIIYYLWRWEYYGHLFPLPFYLKTSTTPYLAGRGALLGFAKYMGLHLGILLVIGVVLIKKHLLPAVISVCGLIIFFAFPSHIMGFNWRYFFPIIPFIFIIATIGLAKLFSLLQLKLSLPAKPKRTVCSGILFGIFLLVSLGFLREIPSEIQLKQAYANGLTTAHITLGKKLAGFNSGTPLPILAIGDAGAVPYYSRWRTIDTYGLNNPEIAITGKHDAVTILANEPDIVVLISQDESIFIPKLFWEQALYQQCLAHGMIVIKTLPFRLQEYYLWIMVDPESTIAHYLKNGIN